MPTLDAVDASLRIGAASGCGELIGLERESRNQLAGMRTHALVAAGAAVFTLAGAHGFPELARGSNVDPMRVAAQIASGIGFIGAGAIIRDRGSVRGVTTAAALWTSAALGLAAGAGMWWMAAAGAMVTLLVLVALRPLSTRLLTPFATPCARLTSSTRRGTARWALCSMRSERPERSSTTSASAIRTGIQALGRGRLARARPRRSRERDERSGSASRGRSLRRAQNPGLPQRIHVRPAVEPWAAVDESRAQAYARSHGLG